MAVRLPLRFWLALTYSLFTGLIMASLGAVLYITFDRSLSDELDRRIRVFGDSMQFVIWPDPGFPVADLRDDLDMTQLAQLDVTGLYVQVLDTNGNVVGASDNLRNVVMPSDRASFAGAMSRNPTFATVVAPSVGPVRSLSMPIAVQGQVVGVLRVAQSRVPLEETLFQLRNLLVVFGAGALVVAGVGSWFVAYRGLRPLAVASSRAADIAARRDFSQRLEFSNRHDEVGQLAGTVDHLLGTVEETLRTHREFVADTSHELRNPLLAIRTNLDLLDRLPGSEASEECVREARQQVERMSRLVSDLLLLAQVERGLVIEHQPVHLRAVAQRAVQEAAQRATGQLIVLDIRAELDVLGDEDRLLQVIVNLLDNAIKHTASGGGVEVSVDRVEGWALVAVSDSGIGIAVEHLPHVFDRSYRVNPSQPGPGGYGLGLAIVKYLTEAHGGRVSAASKVGEGSVFRVWLPVLATARVSEGRVGREFSEPGVEMGETFPTAP